MLSRLLRKFLFNFLHCVISVLVAVQNVYYRILFHKNNIRTKEVIKSEIQMILERMPRSSKPLKHVVMLVDTDHHCISDLARLVIWSLVAGVPYLSFFDTTGELYENEEKLFYEVEKFKKGVPGCVKWSKLPNLNGYSNGNAAHTVIVNIFRDKDGRSTIADCIQQIAEEKIVCKRNSIEYTAEEFGETLSQFYPHIPDPDMVLYTGRVCCTKGLLPWQIRLSVFIELSPHHILNVDQYLVALHKYSKCDQRFGK